jgi:Mg2+ and Co2+ transporter CorA
MTPSGSPLILVRFPDGSVEEVAPARVDEIDTYTGTPGCLVWVSATNPDDRLISELQREFHLHPLV